MWIYNTPCPIPYLKVRGKGKREAGGLADPRHNIIDILFLFTQSFAAQPFRARVLPIPFGRINLRKCREGDERPPSSRRWAAQPPLHPPQPSTCTLRHGSWTTRQGVFLGACLMYAETLPPPPPPRPSLHVSTFRRDLFSTPNALFRLISPPIYGKKVYLSTLCIYIYT